MRIRSRAAATVVAVATLFTQSAFTPATTATTVSELATSWVSAQFLADGSVVGRTGAPDVPNTIAATLALTATGHVHERLDDTVAYVEANLDDYVAGAVADDYGPAGTGERPGPLANLLLFADATDVDPRTFGGSDLIARLEATEQPIGPDAGSFGRQLDVFGHTYTHATVVYALADVDTVAPSEAAVAHLLDLQCRTGGFPSGYRNAVQRLLDDCTGDSNATGLALAALATVGGQDDAVARGVAFLNDTVNDDGGWGYTPGDATDGNSTGLAGFGLRLAGEDVRDAAAAIAALQLGCDAPPAHVGGIRFVASDTAPNSFATFQAMLAFDVATDHEHVAPCAPPGQL